jgi:hypothetical protein
MCSLIQPLTGDFAVSKMTLTTYYQGMSTELQSARGMQRLKLLTTSSPNVCLPGNSGNKYVQRWHPNFPQSESFSRIQVHHYKYCPDLPSLCAAGNSEHTTTMSCSGNCNHRLLGACRDAVATEHTIGEMQPSLHH